MKIEIEINNIEGYETLSVRAGHKYNDDLTYEEALGLVAVLLMPKNRIPCLHWLKTKETHEEEARIRLQKDVDFEDEKSTIPNWVSEKANVQFKTNKLN